MKPRHRKAPQPFRVIQEPTQETEETAWARVKLISTELTPDTGHYLRVIQEATQETEETMGSQTETDLHRADSWFSYGRTIGTGAAPTK